MQPSKVSEIIETLEQAVFTRKKPLELWVSQEGKLWELMWVCRAENQPIAND